MLELLNTKIFDNERNILNADLFVNNLKHTFKAFKFNTKITYEVYRNITIYHITWNDDKSYEDMLELKKEIALALGVTTNEFEIEKEKEIIDKNLNQVELLRNSLESDLYNHKQKEKEILEKAKKEARQILLDAKAKATNIIKDLNELSESNTSLKHANNLRNQLNTSLKDYTPSLGKTDIGSLTSKDITIGMTVLVKTLNTKAIVLSLPNKSNEVQLQIGNAKTTMNINKLEKANAEKQSSTYTKKSINLKSKNISSEINVIGQNVDEAIFVIDKYLDDCSLAKISPVRIVHGKGTGKLRQGIHTFLKTNPHVKSFRLGTFGEGEMGVTIVEIK